jgi:protein-tyrosine phosphatase
MAYVPDAHEIVPGIWLGNARASRDAVFLKKNNIEVVFNATKDIPFYPGIRKQYRIPVDDNLEPAEIRNMTLWSHEIIYHLLKEHNAGHTVLVHCAAGMQRSATIVGMYLIVTRGMTWQQAITYTQGIRPIAFRPNPNFKNSLIDFYKTYQEDILPQISH